MALPPAYTVRISAQKAFTGTLVYNTPAAGVCVVVRDIDGFLYSTGSGSTEFIFRGSADQILFAQVQPSTGGPISWRGRQMIGPGEHVSFQAVSEADFAVTAYIFAGVSPYF